MKASSARENTKKANRRSNLRKEKEQRDLEEKQKISFQDGAKRANSIIKKIYYNIKKDSATGNHTTRYSVDLVDVADNIGFEFLEGAKEVLERRLKKAGYETSFEINRYTSHKFPWEFKYWHMHVDVKW